MSDAAHGAGGAGPSHRMAEIGVGVFIAVLGAIAVYGSLKVGASWGADGPGAGFFPFYIGVVILISSAVNLTKAFLAEDDGSAFATWSQLRQVCAVVVPTAVYVFVIPVIGIYLASAILIAVFMRWLGRYGWTIVGLISVGVPILTYFMFEIWFLVPLPKGPIEKLIGLTA